MRIRRSILPILIFFCSNCDAPVPTEKQGADENMSETTISKSEVKSDSVHIRRSLEKLGSSVELNLEYFMSVRSEKIRQPIGEELLAQLEWDKHTHAWHDNFDVYIMDTVYEDEQYFRWTMFEDYSEEWFGYLVTYSKDEDRIIESLMVFYDNSEGCCGTNSKLYGDTLCIFEYSIYEDDTNHATVGKWYSPDIKSKYVNRSENNLALNFTKFNEIPEEIEGCACLFSSNQWDFEQDKFIYVDDYYAIVSQNDNYGSAVGQLAFVQVNETMVKILTDSLDKNEFNVQVRLDFSERSGDEVWIYSGSLWITYKEGDSYVLPFYGECGC